MQRVKKALEEFKDIGIIILAVILFFVFILSQNSVPSESMYPTIQIGDRIVVSMIPYYYRQPQRGEIVVFNGPDGNKWVKRVIALPGETVNIVDGNIYIDDRPLDESTYLNAPRQSGLDPRYEAVDFPYTVPKDAYFLMGDNRLSSEDSRYIGAVKSQDITGKALFRIYPFHSAGSLK